MGFLDWLFRRLPPPPATPPRDVRSLTAGSIRPAARLARTEGPSASFLGGRPSLPAGVAWPSHKGAPLTFLAQLSLPELHRAIPLDWLPPDGALLFFYDLETMPWGFDPADRGSWAVLHLPAPALPAGGESALPRIPVDFHRLDSRPSAGRPDIAPLRFTDAEHEAYEALRREPFGEAPAHQVGGFPDPVQDDGMELECQLVTHGLYLGDGTGHGDPRAASLRPGEADWRLLLQLDSDDDLNVMWGDLGRVYFWVREPDARRKDLSGAWLVLQCS